MEILTRPLGWRECRYVSLANAARIAGRAPSWTVRAICMGDLEAVRLRPGTPEVVTVESLAAFLDRATPVIATRQPVERKGGRDHLRLVGAAG